LGGHACKGARVALRRAWLGITVFVVCSLFIGPQCALARIEFQPISPDEVKMTAEPQAPGAPAIILYRQVDRDDRGNTAHEDDYYRIKILTEQGRKYADVEIPFFKENGINIVHIKARTIRPDGSTVNFEGKVFEKAIAKAKGLKYMAKTFTLPDVQVGSIIEYIYTLDLSEHYVYDSHWILSDELFTRSARFSLRPYTSSYVNLTYAGFGRAYRPARRRQSKGRTALFGLKPVTSLPFRPKTLCRRKTN
jgi:hypothetical protein